MLVLTTQTLAPSGSQTRDREPLGQDGKAVIFFSGHTMGVRVIILYACLASASATLEVVNQWNLMQFDFPPDPVLLEKFQPENTVPTGLEIGWDKIYLGIPRLRAGVPATLAWVPRSLPPGVSPVLQVH